VSTFILKKISRIFIKIGKLFYRHIEKLHIANCVGSSEKSLMLIIKHLAKFPIRDPVAFIEHFWDEFCIREYSSEDERVSMSKITRLFIFVELKYNLKKYIGGAEQGLPANSHLMIELGRGCILDCLTPEE
jgi:hypothetical protein